LTGVLLQWLRLGICALLLPPFPSFLLHHLGGFPSDIASVQQFVLLIHLLAVPSFSGLEIDKF
jgi:hypothetical protein